MSRESREGENSPNLGPLLDRERTNLDRDEEEDEADVDEVLVGEGEHEEGAQQALLRRHRRRHQLRLGRVHLAAHGAGERSRER